MGGRHKAVVFYAFGICLLASTIISSRHCCNIISVNQTNGINLLSIPCCNVFPRKSSTKELGVSTEKKRTQAPTPKMTSRLLIIIIGTSYSQFFGSQPSLPVQVSGYPLTFNLPVAPKPLDIIPSPSFHSFIIFICSLAIPLGVLVPLLGSKDNKPFLPVRRPGIKLVYDRALPPVVVGRNEDISPVKGNEPLPPSAVVSDSYFIGPLQG